MEQVWVQVDINSQRIDRDNYQQRHTIYELFFLSTHFFISQQSKYNEQKNIWNIIQLIQHFKVYYRPIIYTLNIMRPSLTVPQKQAYEGARSFYLCFLPTVIVILTLSISWNATDAVSYLYAILMIVSYALACKFYNLCNTINTTVDYFMTKSHNTQLSMQVEHQNQLKSNTLSQTQEQYDQNTTIRPPQFRCSHRNCLSSSPSSLTSSSTVQATPSIRPYRSKHCSKCQVCIFRYDHHCFWIGNCVGYQNHRQFYLFLLLQTLNNIFVLFSAQTLKTIVGDKDGNISDNTDDGWVKWGLVAVEVGAFGFLLFTGYLGLYHTMLMMTGMTTWEHMSRSRITYLKHLKSGINPFSKGLLLNIYEFWVHSQQDGPVYSVPTYEQANAMEPGCNIIENKYYSCC